MIFLCLPQPKKTCNSRLCISLIGCDGLGIDAESHTGEECRRSSCVVFTDAPGDCSNVASVRRNPKSEISARSVR